MGFTNEDYVEEILYGAHKEGKYIKLLKKVDKLKQKNPKQNRVDIYIKAWQKIKK